MLDECLRLRPTSSSSPPFWLPFCFTRRKRKIVILDIFIFLILSGMTQSLPRGTIRSDPVHYSPEGVRAYVCPITTDDAFFKIVQRQRRFLPSSVCASSECVQARVYVCVCVVNDGVCVGRGRFSTFLIFPGRLIKHSILR